MQSHFELADGRKVAVPRAAVWIGEAAGTLWRWLEALGEARAQQALRQAASHLDITDPRAAAQLRGALRSGPIRG